MRTGGEWRYIEERAMLCDHLEKQLAERDATIERLRSECDSMRRRWYDLERIQDRQLTFDSVAMELANSEEKRRQADATIERLQSKLTQFTEVHPPTIQRIAELTAELNYARGHAREAWAAVEKVEVQLAERDATIAQQAERIAELETDLGAARRERDEANQWRERDCASLDGQIVSARAERDLAFEAARKSQAAAERDEALTIAQLATGIRTLIDDNGFWGDEGGRGSVWVGEGDEDDWRQLETAEVILERMTEEK